MDKDNQIENLNSSGEFDDFDYGEFEETDSNEGEVIDDEDAPDGFDPAAYEAEDEYDDDSVEGLLQLLMREQEAESQKDEVQDSESGEDETQDVKECSGEEPEADVKKEPEEEIAEMLKELQNADEDVKINRKKRNHIILAGVSIVLVLITVFLVYYLYSALPYEKVDLTQYFSVEYNGYDSNGSAEVYFDEEQMDVLMASVKDTIDSQLIKFSVPQKEDYALFRKSVEAQLSQYSGLSNGDSISLMVSYDRALADRLNIEIATDSKEVTVEGLPVVTTITKEEVFEDIDVVFDGISPMLTASLQNNSEHPLLKGLTYEIVDPKECYSTGDVVKVRALYTEEQCVNMQYLINVESEECTTEYTASGPSYLDDPDKITESILNRAIEAGKKCLTDEVANEYGVRIFTEAGLTPKYDENRRCAFCFENASVSTVVFKSIFPERAGSTGNNFNDLDLIYSVTFGEHTDSQTTSAYVAVRFSDFVVGEDGSLKYDFAKPEIVTASHMNTRVIKNVVDAYLASYNETKVYP